MQNKFKSLLILLAVLSVIISLFYGIHTFSDLYAKQIENEARFQCAQSSRYIVNQADNTQVWYPVIEMYQNCLAEKGII